MASASLGFEALAARKGTMAPLQAERAKIEQIVAEYYAKALHIVLEARIPQQQNEGYGSHRGGTTTNKWFNLELDSSAHVLESVEPWKRGVCQEPMVVDIWLHQPSSPGQEQQTPNKWSSSSPRQRLRAESWGGDEDIAGSSLLLERWVVHYERKKGSWLGFGPVVKGGARVPVEHASSPEGGAGDGGAAVSPPLSHALERPVVYKRTVIMLRSLYCLVRTLPAFRLFKLATSSSHSRSFSLSYTVSSAPATTLSEQDESAMMKCNLTPIETQWGRLCIYSLYRNATAVTALEVTPRILSRIIPDYVGSPTTDTLRRFPSVGSLPSPGLAVRGQGVHVVQLPGSVPNSPSGAFGRRHSWSGGINKVQSQPPPLPISPSYKSSSPSPSHPYHQDFQNSPPKTPHYFHHSSSPSGTHQPSNLSPRNSPLQRQFVHNHPHHDSQPIPIHPRRSPPFSPSPSPSPPQHGYNSRSKSDPVTIPRPQTNLNRPSVIVRSSADPHHQSRSPLPPPSPQTRLLEKTHSFNSRLQSGNSAGHVSNLSLDNKIAPRSADSSQLVSPRSRPRRPQSFGEDQGDELALSGIKRSVYSPPGLVLREFRASRVSSQNREDPEDVECPFAIDNVESEDYMSRVGSPRPKVPDSPDFQGSTPGSAVGALVRILKGAAPLRQQSAPPAFADVPGPKVGVPSSPMAIAGRGPAKSSPPKPGSLSARNSFKNRPTDFRPTSLGAPTGTGSFGSGGIGSPPSIGVRQASSKSAADALEELRQYREMRDFLVHQSGGGVQVKR